eukprot:jgi/Antlo1/174/1333
MKLCCSQLLSMCVLFVVMLENAVLCEEVGNVQKRMRWYRRGFEVARARNRSTAGACCHVNDGDGFLCMCVTWPLWYPLATIYNFVDGCFKSEEYVNKTMKEKKQRSMHRH